MKFAFILITALTTAATSVATTFNVNPGLEIRAKGDRHHHAHGVKADFRKPCDCGEDRCPSFLNKKALCECKAAHYEGCYYKSERGCPKPSFKSC